MRTSFAAHVTNYRGGLLANARVTITSYGLNTKQTKYTQTIASAASKFQRPPLMVDFPQQRHRSAVRTSDSTRHRPQPAFYHRKYHELFHKETLKIMQQSLVTLVAVNVLDIGCIVNKIRSFCKKCLMT